MSSTATSGRTAAKLRAATTWATPLLLLVLCASCSAGPGRSSPPQPRGTLTPADLRLARDAASPAQLAFFEDGTLTFAEYEQATLDHVACLVDAGATVGELELWGGRFFFVPQSFPAPSGGLRDSPVGQAVVACHQEYQVIADIWAYLNPPTQREQEQARQMLIACLRDRGYPLPDDPQPADLERAAAAPPSGGTGDCFSDVRREFGPLNSGY